MLPFTPPARHIDADFAASLTQPLTPAGYLTLRREAAGFSPEQLARALVMLDDHRRPLPCRRLTLEQGRTRYRRMLDLVRLLERRGSVTRCRDTLAAIASLFPFDPAVYRALVDAPADSHPRICRSCGCSGHDACIDHHENVCRWVTPKICSACVSQIGASLAVAA